MKNKSSTNKEHIIFVLLAAAPQIGIVIIICIAILKCCLSPEPDPMDNDVNRIRQLVATIRVVDSTYNGFRVTYATERAVSMPRLDEICSRGPLQASLRKLQCDAPIHFGSLLQTNIYDFAAFAREYDCDPDVKMDRIYVYGKEKSELYIGPNPDIENSARWMNFGTQQGIQYINATDIYFRRRTENRIYRYWQCPGLHSTSSTDERFSHFSEDDRLW